MESEEASEENKELAAGRVSDTIHTDMPGQASIKRFTTQYQGDIFQSVELLRRVSDAWKVYLGRRDYLLHKHGC